MVLQSDLLSYIKLRKYLNTDGFKFNPYDQCVANKILEGGPLTIVLHGDDVKSIHKDKKLVDNFEQWIEFMYGYPNTRRVKLLRVKFHEYFPMALYYTTKEEVKNCYPKVCEKHD